MDEAGCSKLYTFEGVVQGDGAIVVRAKGAFSGLGPRNVRGRGLAAL